MSNPGGVNLNIGPYFDDYDEDKKFVRVLYRPGRAVQARELTQAQSISQKQIQRFAEYFFRDGAVIDGCEQVLDLRQSFLKLQSTILGENVDVNDFVGKEIIGANTGIRAYVGLATDLEGNDPKTLFVNYLSTGAVIIDVEAPGAFISIGNTVTFNSGNTGVVQAFYQDFTQNTFSVILGDLNGNATSNTTATYTGSDGNIFTMNVGEVFDKRTSKRFEDEEVIFVKIESILESPNTAIALTALNRATTFIENEGLSNQRIYEYGSKFALNNGTLYIADHFVKHDAQVIILDKYKNEPSYKIGVVPVKSFIDIVDDQSLLDNAQGTPNFQALGADRLRIDTLLTKVPLDQNTDETEFVRIVEVKDGILRARVGFEVDSKLENAIARRTFEESGDYTINDPKVLVREHLRNNNNGRFLASDGGNNELLFVEVDPFVSYVKGYRNDLLVKSGVPLRKGLDVEFVNSVDIQVGYGGYVYVKEFNGSWNVNESKTIDLYDEAFRAISNSSFSFTTVTGSKIGTAKVKSFEYASGTPGSSDAVYIMYLYDVIMNSGKLFEQVRGLYDSTFPANFADINVSQFPFNRVTLLEPLFDKLIFPLPFSGIKTLRDTNNNVDTTFKFKKEFTASFSGAGIATVSTTDAFETFDSGATSILKNRNYLVIPTSNSAFGTGSGANTSALSGGATVNVASEIVSAFNLTGTLFLTQFNVGEVIRVNGEDRIVRSVTNNFFLTVESAFSTTANGVTYSKSFPAGRPINLNAFGSTGVSRSVVLSIGDGATTIDLKETGITSAAGTGFVAKVIVTMDRDNAREMRKILNVATTCQINPNTHPNFLAGPFPLGHADVYKIRSIHQSSGFGVTATTSNTNVTSLYDFDNGQRDNSYEYGSITPKIGTNITGNLLVVFDNFTHDTTQGVGYLSVDSYPVNDLITSNTTILTSEIPVYVSGTTGEQFNLRDCIDFRPIRVANTSLNPIDAGSYVIPSGGLHLSAPNDDFIADLQYYKGRKAKIYINTAGEIGINDGAPGYPFANSPPSIPDTLEIAEINVPPYPSEPKKCFIAPYRNKRYTMQDINTIQNRVNKLEYYTALSMLERQAKDKIEIDDAGIDRFKNGILTDAFVGYNIADVTNSDYRASISRQEKYSTAYANNEVQMPFRFLTTGSSNIKKTDGNKVLLNYTETVHEEQPYASTGINLAVDITFNWLGDMEVLPATDNWLDTINDPENNLTIDLTGLQDNWIALAEAWNTEISPVNTFWQGAGTVERFGQVTQRNQRETGTRQAGGAWGDWLAADLVQSVTTIEIEREFVQEARVISGTEQSNQVDRVSNVSINNYMRPREFIFAVYGLKDNSQLFAFFDDLNVTANCTQIVLAEGKTIEDVYALQNDNGIFANDASVYTRRPQGTLTVSSNRVFGIFKVPQRQFLVGQREFKITDSPTNKPSDETTYARASIFSSGFSVYKSSTSLNSRPTEVRFNDETARRETGRSRDGRVIGTEDRTIGVRLWDPVSQSFIIDGAEEPDGIFTTSIDLFFREKSPDPNLGVTVEIREMFNGFPTRKIIGNEVARVENSNIKLSSNANEATKFTFKNPVYLLPDTEYCFTVKPDGNSTEFIAWIAQLGDIDITNPQISARIDKPPAAGVIFTSSNDRTWSVRQNQDMKFTIRKAVFSQTGTVILENLPTTNDNFIYTSISPNISDILLPKTNINYEIRRAGLGGALTSFESFNNRDLITETTPKQFANTATESTGAFKSATIRATLRTLNTSVSPYIDLQSINAALNRNVINNETGKNLTGLINWNNASNIVTGFNTLFTDELAIGEFVKFNEEYRQVNFIANNEYLEVKNDFATSAVNSTSVIYENEENPTGPYASETRYISRKVILNDGFEASDLVVYVDTNKPPGTTIKVYYRILNENDIDSFNSKFYKEMVLDSVSNVTLNPRQYSEEKYIVSSSEKTGGQQILNGSVAITNASKDVIGTNTRFFDELKIGDTIAVGPNRIRRVVENIANSTFLTVTENFSSTVSNQELFRVLNNSIEYTTPDGRSYSGFKSFAIKIVYLSNNISYAPRVKNLRAIALA